MTSPMSPHDPLCPSMDDRYLPVRLDCQCPLIERVKDREYERYGFPLTEAEIRADERERMAYLARVVPGGGIRDWAAAEAVAAKLVEVICEQDREWAGTEWRAMRRERDAARAEVAVLSGALNVAIRLLSDVGITCTVESLFEELES